VPTGTPLSGDVLRAAVDRLLAADAFPVERIVKKRARTIDARPLVRSAGVTPHGRIRVELAVGTTGSIKPSLLVGTLLDVPAATVPLIGVHKAGASFHPETPSTALLGA